MRKYEYALSPTSQFYFCGIPFRFDTTPKCAINCLYCFAMARGGRRTSPDVFADPRMLEGKIERAFNIEFKNKKPVSLITEFLARKTPVHFGGISDPFSSEKAIRISTQVLQIFNRYEYPVVLSTKNPRPLTAEPLLSCLHSMSNIIIQVSLTTLDNCITTAIEPNAPPIQERIRAISALAKEGFHIMVRLQPLLIDQITNLKDELIPMLGEVGVKHIIIEFLKLPVEKNVSLFNNFIKRVKVNYYQIYNKLGMSLVGREWILSSIHRWDLLLPLIRAIHDSNMTYGAADYGLNHLGDTDCCCGFDRVKGFNNWCKSNFPYLIRRSRTKRILFAGLYKTWSPSSGLRKYLNSNCRYSGKSKMIDYLKIKWNRPGTANAPDTFLGVSCTGLRDEEGNLIYEKGEIRDGPYKK